MPFYGTDLNAMIDIKSDRAYSNYFDPAKKNRIVREAVVKSIDKMVSSNDRIQIQDNLFGIMKTNFPVTPVANTISISQGGTGITDYMHLMNIVSVFQVRLDAYITKATPTTPCVITLNKASSLRTGSEVVISGVTGATNANGVRYLGMISPTKFELFSNSSFSTPIVGNGTFSGSATMTMNIKEFCKNINPSTKFSTLNSPTIFNPYYEIADSKIKVYPLDYACSSCLVDYVSLPPQIDVQNAATDLLTIFSERFLEFIADESCRLMGMYSRDAELQFNEQSEIIQQP